ncbi:hypothetical protein ACQKOM_04900 [Peribacillus frigoritolerans]
MKKIIYVISAIPALGSLVVINRIEPYVLGCHLFFFGRYYGFVLHQFF